jgi:exosome complex component RRP40
MSTIVLPGDRISIPSSSNVKLGPGLAVSSSQEAEDQDQGHHEFTVTLPGFLGQVSSDKGKSKADQMQVDGPASTNQAQRQQLACWVESNSKRYLPALHDQVICQITNRGTESYQVSLFNSFTSATLSGFAFEGATKRNKPNLKVGTLLYAQVLSASRHLEVELTCVDQNTGKSNGYGELKTEEEQGGKTVENTAMLWSVSCGLARR